MRFRLGWVGLLAPALVVVVALTALLPRPGGRPGPLWERVTSWIGPGSQEVVPSPPERVPEAVPGGGSSARPPDSAPAQPSAAAALPVASPYRWAATRAGDAVRLTGHVPSESARAEVLAAARRIAPQGELEDRMEAAGGLDPRLDYGALTTFALAQLRELRSGSIELSDTVLSARGAARDRSAVAALRSAMEREVPGGVSVGKVEVSAPPIEPFPFTARRGPGLISIGGYLPDERARAEILALVRRRFLTEQVVDESRLGDGARPDFVRGVLFGLEQLAQLAAGEVAISDASLRVLGEALYEQAAEQTRRMIASAPPGWKVSAEITTSLSGLRVGAEVCQERLQRRLAQTRLRFDGAEIARESHPVLDDLAAIVRRCDARIEVAGQAVIGETDRDLALARAKAVSAYLVAGGVEATRVSAVTQGLTQAPAPSDPEEAKRGGVELLAKASL